MAPPVQQQYQTPAAPPKAPPVQVHRMQTRTSADPNLPTPGVPKAAGLKNMSVDTSEYTEETVTEQEVSPKTPSFFRRVASTLTGQSSSDGSSVSTHMKQPPKKYYVKTVTSDTEEETDSSTSL